MLCSKIEALFITLILLINLDLDESYAQPSAVITPRGYNASLDPEVSFTFQCDVTGADTIQWVVDGLPSTRSEIRSRGISESDPINVNTTAGSFRGNISIERNVMNKNTSIICVAGITLSAGVPSEPVLFKVQGLLNAPSNLILSNTTRNVTLTRRLSWDKPFSLDITDIDPDITYYKVCNSLVNVTLMEKSWCKRVTRTEYIFPFVNIPLYFTVFAVNVVGEGNSSTVLHEATNCNDSKEATIIKNIHSHVSFSGLSGTNPMAVFLFEQLLKDSEVTQCFHVYRIITSPLSTSNITDHGIQIPQIVSYQQPSIRLSLTVNTKLVVNENYHAIFVVINANGETDNNETIVNFDTYDVQLVSGTVLPGGLELTCTFAEGSQAQSCVLTVCRTENGIAEFCKNLTINREEATESGQINNIQTGLYTVKKVAEIESNGQLTIHRKKDVLELRVIESSITTKSGSISKSVISLVLINIGSVVAFAVVLDFSIACTRKKLLQKVEPDSKDLIRNRGTGIHDYPA